MVNSQSTDFTLAGLNIGTVYVILREHATETLDTLNNSNKNSSYMGNIREIDSSACCLGFGIHHRRSCN